MIRITDPDSDLGVVIVLWFFDKKFSSNILRYEILKLNRMEKNPGINFEIR
jgi:hypothetical protein